jgi:energy-coupling factor transport system substrate-specific component
MLASTTGRRMGRVGLAVACGVAGLAFGALMDLSLMVTYGGAQSLDRYLALSARGLPFNLAHAAGNVALALVAGPAIARMLLRYRERFEFAWGAARREPRGDRARGLSRRAGAGLACLLVGALVAGQLVTGPDADGAAQGPGAAVGWLRDAQNGDGGFGPGPGDESDPAITGWVVLGLESAGVNPLDVGSPSPIAYLRGTVKEIRTTGDIERTILALVGAGLDPRDFAGADLVSRLRARRGGDGSIAGQVNLTAFSILALDAAGAEAGNGRSAAWLARAANPDGGWGFAPGTAGDPDSTGAAMQALAAAGRDEPVRRGRAYLRLAQRRNGGFALLGGPVNAQSTAWAVQGLIAAGLSPSAVRAGGRSPLDYLAGIQAADGHYRYSSSSDQTPAWVTAQALSAVSGRAFPLAPVPRRPVQLGGDAGTVAPAVDPLPADAGSKRGGAPAPAPSTTKAEQGAEWTGYAPLDESTPEEPASSGDDEGASAMSLPLVLGGGALALVSALGAGWLVHRRRAS